MCNRVPEQQCCGSENISFGSADPELPYESGSRRPIIYGSGRIRILPGNFGGHWKQICCQLDKYEPLFLIYHFRSTTLLNKREKKLHTVDNKHEKVKNFCLPFKAMTLLAGFIMAESAEMGRLIGLVGSDMSIITTWKVKENIFISFKYLEHRITIRGGQPQNSTISRDTESCIRMTHQCYITGTVPTFFKLY